MRKIISKILCLIMVLSNMPLNIIQASQIGDKVHLVEKYPNDQQILIGYNGHFNPTNNPYGHNIVEYAGSDGQMHPAYCIDSNKWGAEGLNSYIYKVDIQKEVTDPKFHAIITNGYPFKSPSELGVSTEYEAYMATKMALYATSNTGFDYSNMSLWSANSSVVGSDKVLSAMKNLYNIGANATTIEAIVATATALDVSAKQDNISNEHYSQTFEVTANVNIKSFTVDFAGTVPSGTIVTDLENNPKTTFNVGEKFKVLIPQNSVTENGNFNLDISVETTQKPIYYTTEPRSDTQDYLLIGEKLKVEDTKATVIYNPNNDDIPEEPTDPNDPTTPTDPEQPEEASSGLQVVKVEAGTTTGLSGAEIKLVDLNGGVLGHYYTDGSGQITVPNLPEGTYYVEEITPPKGYQLDENNHKDFVIDGKVDPVVITFENYKQNELEIAKVDIETNKMLTGATFKVEGVDNSFSTTVTTDSSGTARISELDDGVYKVTEIVAPNGYILNSVPQEIHLQNGVIETLTFANQEKPKLKIKKIDEATGMALANATFKVEEKNGGYVEEFTTDISGEIQLEGLNNGWYSLTEVVAPSGYLLDDTPKDVFFDSGKTIEVVFTNRQRPALEIVKIDADTKKPLVGAVFKVEEVQSQTVSEYITDSNGTIYIENLNEKIYKVTEITAPDGYVIDTTPKDILLEWGKAKTLIFENRRMPSLKLVKTDAITGEALQGAKFEIEKLEEPNKGIVTGSPFTTDANGEILIEKLYSGKYKITELEAPNNYELPIQNEWIIEIKYNEDYPLEIENIKKPTLVINKLSGLSNKGLSGATFLIEQRLNNGTYKSLGYHTTDSNGQIILPYVDSGWFRVTEITPPIGYQLSSNPTYEIYLGEGENSYTEIWIIVNKKDIQKRIS